MLLARHIFDGLGERLIKSKAVACVSISQVGCLAILAKLPESRETWFALQT